MLMAVLSGAAVLLVAGIHAGGGILPGIVLGYILFRPARIAEVDMCIDKARRDGQTGGIEHGEFTRRRPVGRLTGVAPAEILADGFADRDDPVPADQNVLIAFAMTLWIDDVAVFN